MKKTAYKRNKNMSIQQWTIETEGAKYRTHFGQVGGKITPTEWTLCTGKNIGRSNETTPEQQAELEAESKYKEKIDKQHYHASINEIDQEIFIKPMLAKKWEDHKHKVKFPVFSDPKLDGGRGIFSKRGFQTRRGTDIWATPHINEILAPLLQHYPDLVLDGELYNHDLRHNLNRIMSLIRKTKNLTKENLEDSRKNIEFWVYDGWGFKGVCKNTPFWKRKEKLAELLGEGKDMSTKFVKIRLVQSVLCEDEGEVNRHYELLIQKEFEGQIIRHTDCPYLGSRSDTLLKRKDFEDDEFKVISFEEGKGNKAGMAMRANCLTKDGKEFGVGINGTEKFVKDLWNNPDKWIGKKAHVRFLKYSEYGKPLIGKLIAFRHDLV